MIKKYLLSLIFIGVMIVGCYTSTTQGGLVGENSKQLLLISSEQMDQSANQAYIQTLSDAKTKNSLNTDIILTKRVKVIADRLIKQVGTFRKDALNWNWQVNVIDQDILNAWCMPGGKIAVYSGLIKRLNLTDAQLAAVLGHEIAHALREHSREQASNDKIKNLGIFAITKVAGLDSSATNLMELATRYTIMLPFSRAHETQADHIGTELMARAGYDPQEAVRVWVKMSKFSKQSTPEILSTHPSNASRIADLKNIANKVMPLYLATKN